MLNSAVYSDACLFEPPDGIDIVDWNLSRHQNFTLVKGGEGVRSVYDTVVNAWSTHVNTILTSALAT